MIYYGWINLWPNLRLHARVNSLFSWKEWLQGPIYNDTQLKPKYDQNCVRYRRYSDLQVIISVSFSIAFCKQEMQIKTNFAYTTLNMDEQNTVMFNSQLYSINIYSRNIKEDINLQNMNIIKLRLWRIVQNNRNSPKIVN